MLTALKNFIAEKGYTNIYRDFMPDETVQPEAINLSRWEQTVNSQGDGTGAHYVQVQVRRADYDDAYSVCKSIFALLDSGIDEKPFVWGGHTYICRPRRAPLLLERTGTAITFYCEIVIFGDN